MTHAHVEAGKNTKNVVVTREAFRVPGFRVAAAASGMRYSGRPDLALIWCDDAAAGAGVFTRNRFCAVASNPGQRLRRSTCSSTTLTPPESPVPGRA